MKTLCADLGGTRLKLAAVENGVVLENEVSPIETNSGMEKVLENLGARCRAMMARHPGGEWKAKRLFDIQAKALGAGAVSLLHAFDAETVIFSGGGSRFRALLDAAERYVNDHAWTPWGKVKFIVARHPEDSVVLGLYSLFVHHVC